MSGISGYKIPMRSPPLVSSALSANAEVHDQSSDSRIPTLMTNQRNGDFSILPPINSPHWNYWHRISANHGRDVPTGIVLPIPVSEAGKQPDRRSKNTLEDDKSWILAQNLDSSKQQLDKKNCTTLQPHPMVTVPMPGFFSNPGHTVLKVSSEQKRRERISRAVQALEELVPNPTRVGKVAVLDDIIDYIRFLKLQLKALSRNRLGGEAISDPLLYLEGYGHYLCHDQLKGDPLEEIMGELMEADLEAAMELLDSKGQSIIPMALANDLIQFD